MDIKCNAARGVLKKTTVGGKLAEVLIGLVFIVTLSPFMLIATIGIQNSRGPLYKALQQGG